MWIMSETSPFHVGVNLDLEGMTKRQHAFKQSSSKILLLLRLCGDGVFKVEQVAVGTELSDELILFHLQFGKKRVYHGPYYISTLNWQDETHYIVPLS